MLPSIGRLKYFSRTSVIAFSLYISISFLIAFYFAKSCLVSKIYSNFKNNLRSKKSEASDPIMKFDQIYTNRDVVNCFDTLLTKHKTTKLHIAFIGDSLVRNQFINFLRFQKERHILHAYDANERRSKFSLSQKSKVKILAFISKLMAISFSGQTMFRMPWENTRCHFKTLCFLKVDSIFLRLIPEYDRKFTRYTPSWGIENFHDDRNATHGLLNEFQISFLWRPVIDEKFLEEFKKWDVAEDDEAPFMTFLGVSVHHMLGEHQSNRSFEQILEKDLLPVLDNYLTAHPLRQLVWLIQTPSLDKHVSLPREIHQYPEVHFDSILHYNDIARRILKETPMRIRLFNLFDPFVNEYIRGCAYQGYQRRDPENFVHCNDLLHPGFGATFSFSTQLLFKYICN